MRFRVTIFGLLLWVASAVGPPALAATGDVISSFGAPNSTPFGIAWDGSSLWHGDESGFIYELNTTGTVLSSFAAPCVLTRGITFDGTNLWTVCDGTDVVYELTRTGTIVSSFIPPGGNPQPRGLAWDGTNLWLADANTNLVYELTTTGTIVSSFGTPATLERGLVWTGTHLWLASNTTDLIYKLTTTGTVVSSFSTPSSVPRGLGYDGTNFWASDNNTDLIYELEGPRSVSGKIFVDLVGDALADGPVGSAANPPESGARVELYLDGGDGIPDGGDDSYQGFDISSGVDGLYEFTGLADGTYWVTVDSHGVDEGPYNVGYSGLDTWCEQTYGPVGAASFNGSWSFAGSAGPFYGGAEWDVSDDFIIVNSLVSGEHIARAVVAGAAVVDVDFGFSFNVVTTTRGGSSAQDPNAGGGQRTVQGSLRQFITNANAQDYPSAMRFVPVAPTNGSGGGQTWWTIAVTDLLPAVSDDGTTIDGTAYDAADGVSLRVTNTASLGTGGFVGTGGAGLPQLDGPELEITDGAALLYGLDLQADSATVRRIGIYGFGSTNFGTGNIRAGIDASTNFTGVVIEENLIGSRADGFSDPDLLVAGSGTEGSGVALRGVDAGFMRENLVGFVERLGVTLGNSADDWTIERNEFRRNGLGADRLDGLGIGDGSTRAIVTDNLFVDNKGTGVDFFAGGGSNTIRNNTFELNGWGGTETAGIRGLTSDNLIELNVFQNNAGAGVLIVVFDPAFPTAGTPGLRNRISRNHFIGNGANAIDLQTTLDLIAPGDGITTNDGTMLGDSSNPTVCGIDVNDGNEGLDTPLIDLAIFSSPTSMVQGRACPGAEVEIYRAIADGDASDTLSGTDYGEGVQWLATAIADGVTGAFSIGTVPGLSPGDAVSAIAIDTNDNTSEFSPNFAVTGLAIVKRAFQIDGTPIVNGSTLPAGTPVRFVLYVDNPGLAVSDVTLADVLAPTFSYRAESMKVDNSLVSSAVCPGGVCNEAAIFAQVDGSGSAVGDGDSVTAPIDADAASYDSGGLTIELGNGSNPDNAQLDIAADRVWALVFTVVIQ